MSDHLPSSNRALVVGTAIVCLILGIFVAQLLPPDLLGMRDDGMAADEHDHRTDHGAGSEGQLWTCGMHPQVIQDEPGQCPICGMDLTPMQGGSSAQTGAPAHDHGMAAESARWTCPDHPMIVENAPGTCPIDGLDLVPTQPEGAETSTSDAASGGEPRAVVEIDPAVQQNMNVRTETARRRDLTRPIRTVGYLDFDQQRMVTVTTKYSGWVEKVQRQLRRREGATGTVALRDLLAGAGADRAGAALGPRVRRARWRTPRRTPGVRAWSMVESARTRLGYWDVDAQQIARLEETGEVFRTARGLGHRPAGW